MKKRKFLKGIGAASAMLLMEPHEALGHTLISSFTTKKTALVLGGRGFLGPSIVHSLLDNGYEVTLLNRNKTNTHLFKDLPLILCDREKEDKVGLKSIENKYKNTQWDIVVDTWQKSPKAVADFLEVFKGNIGHFHYISTISVYDSWNKKYIKENEPLNPLPSFPKTIAEGNTFRYAIRKTFAEEAVREQIDSYTIYRSSGMKDSRSVDPKNVNEESFWPIRFYRGGEIMLPKVEDHHIQVTDVQSLVNFMLHCAQQKVYGAFNVACRPTLFKNYVDALMTATTSQKTLHWVDGDFLVQNAFLPYKVVPLWKPKPIGSYYFDVQKAYDSGFVHRPLAEMIKDELKGFKKRHPVDDIRFGIQPNGKRVKYSLQEEAELLKKWKASLKR